MVSSGACAQRSRISAGSSSSLIYAIDGPSRFAPAPEGRSPAWERPGAGLEKFGLPILARQLRRTKPRQVELDAHLVEPETRGRLVEALREQLGPHALAAHPCAETRVVI